MGWINQLGGILQKYSGVEENRAGVDLNGDGVIDDFERVTGAAPRSEVADGLAAAFRSDRTAPFPDMVSQLFARSGGQQRSGILNQLIATLGPTLVSQFLSQRGMRSVTPGQPITPEQGQEVSPEAIRELAAQAEKKDPSFVERVSDFYAQHPTLVQGLGALAMAIAMNKMYSRRAA